MNLTTLNHQQILNFKGMRSIKDAQVLEFIKNLSLNHNESTDHLRLEFVKQFEKWIYSSQLNKIKGLNNFQQKDVSLGLTQSFDHFYLAYPQKRLRIFKGEYVYHQIVYKNRHWAYLEDEILQPNDFVVLSWPFSDLGNTHPKTIEILSDCSEKHIPVFIDMAYFGICSGIEFDLSYPCIQHVGFSLSKSFCAENYRIGLRFTRNEIDDGLATLNKFNYISRNAVQTGTALMGQFSPDYNYLKYKNQQEQVCQKLNLSPTSCVSIGLGGNEYSVLNRGLNTNRLCLESEFVQ